MLAYLDVDEANVSLHLSSPQEHSDFLKTEYLEQFLVFFLFHSLLPPFIPSDLK